MIDNNRRAARKAAVDTDVLGAGGTRNSSNETSASHAGRGADSLAGRWDLLLLIVLFGLALGFRLGAWPLINPDEGRYAEIPREMLATGDWVTPRLDGVKYFEKPPLVYWLVAVAQKTVGTSAEAMRLVPVFFALAGVLLTYGSTRRMYGREAGLMAALVLGSAFLYAGLGRVLILDMVVSVLMTATLFCFILGVREPPGMTRRWLFYGLYASAALATLSKGLIGFLVSGAIFFLWLLVFNQWRRLRPFYLPTGVFIFLLIAAPWHLLVAQRNPDWAWFYFVHEHWLRFTTTVHGRYEPWWFFLPVLWLGFFPWSGFIGPALRMVWREGRNRQPASADLGYHALWVGFILVFFSLSDSKLVPYILPAFPAMAVLIGVWMARTKDAAKASSWRVGLRVFSVFSGLLAAALLVVIVKPSLARVEASRVAEIQEVAAALALLLAVGSVAGWRAAARAPSFRALATLTCTAILFVMGATFVVPALMHRSTQPLAEILRREFKPGDQVFSYHDFYHDFPYYSGILSGAVAWKGELEFGLKAEDHSDLFVDDAGFELRWKGPQRVFVVMDEKYLPEFDAAGFTSVNTLGKFRDYILFSNQP